MAGQILDLDGGADSDYFLIDLFGVGNSRINTLDVAATAAPTSSWSTARASRDTFLFRRNATRALIALLSGPSATPGPVRVRPRRSPTATEITGGVVVNGLAGDDTFAFDDTASVLTVNGDSGNDRFRFGQLYTAYVADPEFPADRLLRLHPRPADPWRVLHRRRSTAAPATTSSRCSATSPP